MSNFVLHALTKQEVGRIVHDTPQATLLIGPDGIGKGTLARFIVASIIPDKIGSAVRVIEPEDGKSISIEAVRSLRQFVQLKTIGTAKIRRAIIIEHADTMTTEAQNAFLKLLEEPPADTILILTAAHAQALLPTIRSRVQSVKITPPVESDLKTYFASTAPAQFSQAYFLSGGLPGLMSALIHSDNEHPLLKGVVLAKSILQKPLFERLTEVDALAKQKDQARMLVEALLRMSQTALGQAASKSDQARVRQWHHVMHAASDASAALDRSGNTKLVLSNLMLQL